jgi:hypothetical protein
MSHNRNYQDTYESILGEILAGREATHQLVDGVLSDELRAKYGKELRDFHNDVQSADTSKPGWLSKLLGG